MIKLMSNFFAPGNITMICRTHIIQQQCRNFCKATSLFQKESTTSITNDAEDDTLYKRVEIELRGMDPMVLKSYEIFATTAAKHLNIEVGKCWTPKKADTERYTILKSAFVHKKHRVQYEIRTYFKFMQFHKLTGSTLATFLEYIERNLPEGVALKATKVEILVIPEHLRQPPPEVTSDSQQKN